MNCISFMPIPAHVIGTAKDSLNDVINFSDQWQEPSPAHAQRRGQSHQKHGSKDLVIFFSTKYQ